MIIKDMTSLEQANYTEFLKAKPRYERILGLRAGGLSNGAIARMLGINRKRFWQLNRAIERAKGRGWL